MRTPVTPFYHINVGCGVVQNYIGVLALLETGMNYVINYQLHVSLP